MRYDTKYKKVYNCRTFSNTDIYGCSNERFIEENIVGVVRAVVQSQILYMLDMEKMCRDGIKSMKKGVESRQSVIERLDKEIELLQFQKRKLYERYKSGSIDREAFIKERETTETNMDEKIKERDTLNAQTDTQTSALNTSHQFFGSFLKHHANTEPSDDTVNALVKEVLVFSRDRLEVKFVYADELEKAIELLQNMGVSQ